MTNKSGEWKGDQEVLIIWVGIFVAVPVALDLFVAYAGAQSVLEPSSGLFTLSQRLTYGIAVVISSCASWYAWNKKKV